MRGTVAADSTGRLLQATGEEPQAAREAQQTASTVQCLEALGADTGLGRLDAFVVKGAGRTTVTAVRAGLFVRADLDPSHGTAQVERALNEWTPEAAPTPAGGPQSEEWVGVAEVSVSLSEPVADPWAELRRTLVRGQLTDASALRAQLGQDLPEKIPGGEPLDAPARERAMDGLLEGIGCILAGDVLGGLRTLKPFASPPHPNLSVRWLSLHWSVLGAVRCNGLTAARWFARESILVARQLDVRAQATSQWAAAGVLSAEGDAPRALSWVAEARNRFEKLGDPWGLARACLTEARILCAAQREEEAVEAARRAWAHDPGWDEPPVFLAHRALLRNALDEAGETVKLLGTAAADRIRFLVDGVRCGTVSQEDAAEVLRLQEAPPTVESLRGLDQIARSAPRLVVAREALAWLFLRVGRYADAGTLFQELAAVALTPAIRSSVMLGLGCVAHAQQHAQRPEARTSAPGGSGMTVRAASDPGSTPKPPAPSLFGATGAEGAVFSGKLSVFAVPDLLEFLRGARRTGLLVCNSAAGTAALRFREGRISGAASPATPGVGELLVRARRLSPVVLQGVLERQAGQPRSDGAMGEVLVREGLVDAQHVKAALREQISLAVKELVVWRDGDFAFNRIEGEQGPAEIPVEVDPQEALLNALKDMDEATRERSLA